jgi:hypothetical protein
MGIEPVKFECWGGPADGLDVWLGNSRACLFRSAWPDVVHVYQLCEREKHVTALCYRGLAVLKNAYGVLELPA